jgi:predicted phage terminase large subunit-like protein
MARDGLPEFIERVGRGRLGVPHHMPEYLDIWRRIGEGEPVRAVLSIPPRHWKSETTLLGLAWLIARRPDSRNAFVTYGSNYAREQSMKCRRYAMEAGVELSDEYNRQDGWQTTKHGGLIALGVGGPLIGKGVDGVMVIDDPYKERADAESPAYQRRIAEWFRAVPMTRLERNASVLLIMTRWHPEDLASQCEDLGWEVINKPAISLDDRGNETALMPAYPDGSPAFPVERLHDIRRTMGEWEFAAQYQGQPRPHGGAVFDVATTCALADIPRTGRHGIGIDLAYTAKSRADYSVAVVLREVDGTRYVVDVWRQQVQAPDSVRSLNSMGSRYHAPLVWHASGVERGVADSLTALGLSGLKVETPTGDKFARAQGAAAAWNAGDLVVPHDAPWSATFLAEVQAFTGVGDTHDDQVDALSSAFIGMGPLRPAGPQGTGIYTSGRQLIGKQSRKYV